MPVEQRYIDKLRSVLGGHAATFDDDTICDCYIPVTGLAIEVEFAPKWAEAIGQSLHYASKAGCRPGIYLIVRDIAEEKHINKLIPHCKRLNILLFIKRDYKR